MYSDREVNFWEHEIRLSIDLKTLQQNFLRAYLLLLNITLCCFCWAKEEGKKKSLPYAFLKQTQKETQMEVWWNHVGALDLSSSITQKCAHMEDK